MDVRRFCHMSLSGILLAVLLAGCDLRAPYVAQRPAPPTVPPPPTVGTPTVTSIPSPTLTPTLIPTPTTTPTPSATPIPLSPTPTLAPLAASEREAIFTQVWELVRDRYIYRDYRGLDWDAVRREFALRVAAAASAEEFYDLLREMIDRLGDDHSRFESPQDVAEERARFEGELNYAGIGAIVHLVPEGGLITRLARGGPAEQAGLRPRDLILAVGGIPLADPDAFGPGGPISAIRGAPGSQVRLTVRSPGQAPREVLVTRRTIPADAFPPVEASRLPGTQVGLIVIDTFNSEAIDEQVRARIEQLLQAGSLDGLVLDVRSNGGGRLDLMLGTLALFIDGGSIGTSRGRDRISNLTIPRGETLPQLAGVPIVALIGPDTASAAEMFAAGLQAHQRARLVGMATAGNTENLLPHDLPDGSRLWLAELAYYLPDGSLLEGQGVRPDREVPAEWWRFAPEHDPQIGAALAELGVRLRRVPPEAVS